MKALEIHEIWYKIFPFYTLLLKMYTLSHMWSYVVGTYISAISMTDWTNQSYLIGRCYMP